jgi:hypothetical protein
VDEHGNLIAGTENLKTFEVNKLFNVGTAQGAAMHHNYSNSTFINIIQCMQQS